MNQISSKSRLVAGACSAILPLSLCPRFRVVVGVVLAVPIQSIMHASRGASIQIQGILHVPE